MGWWLIGWKDGWWVQKDATLVKVLIEPLLVDASWTLDSGPGSSCTPLRIVSVCVTIAMVMWSVKSLLMMRSAELVCPVGLAAPVVHPRNHFLLSLLLFSEFFQKDIFICHCFKVNCCQKTAFSAYVSYSNGQHTFLCFNINRL